MPWDRVRLPGAAGRLHDSEVEQLEKVEVGTQAAGEQIRWLDIPVDKAASFVTG